MLRSLKLGKAFGIPLYVHTTFLLLPAWVAFNVWREGPSGVAFALAAMLAVFGCVLLHELGHALMARAFGIGTRDITLYPIGGVARLERMTERPVEEVCIALAGPAVNLAIVLLLTPALALAESRGLLVVRSERLVPPDLSAGALAARFVVFLWLANLVLLLFNLVPAFPMDGGRVLRAVLAMGVGRLRATEVAVILGFGLALFGGGLALWWAWKFDGGNPVLVVVALFVALAGQQELYALRRLEARRRAVERAEALAAADLPLTAEAVALPVEAVAFTGFQWDRERRVWVRWDGGRPVEVLG